MPASVREQRLGDVRWLVAAGRRPDVFRMLGEHAGEDIRAVVASAPELETLSARVRTAAGAAHLAAVARASRLAHPVAWLELEALAAGAGVPHTDLLLLTLRGDFGTIGAEECSDVGVADGRSVLLGHNEDGDPFLHGRCRLLTLFVEGEPAVTTWWYPGFLPGNTFTVNEHGLVCGVDAIHVTTPPPAPGRAFVARGLQGARTLDGAVGWLRGQRSAGGFAYVLGCRGEPRIVAVEHAAGETATLEAGGDRAALWHTNHLRALGGVPSRGSTDSRSRGELLDAALPPAEPSGPWLLDLLAGRPRPAGVRATGEAGAALTLCTFVIDLVAGEAIVLPCGGIASALPLADLAAGVAERARATAAPQPS